MKRRKDLERMSAAMMKIKSPLKLHHEDKKFVASSSDVELKDEPEKDYTQSSTYKQMLKDDKDLIKSKELEKIARQTTGTSKQFETASVEEKRRLLLARRSGVLPASNIVNK